MTNKQERYFVVSESELEAAIMDAQLSALNSRDAYLRNVMKKSKAACRARPVPAWGAYIVDNWGFPDKWVEVKK